jgi:hypothetical protein
MDLPLVVSTFKTIFCHITDIEFQEFLDGYAASTSGTQTSPASIALPTLIPRSAEIDAIYQLPPPRALQGTVERTPRSRQTVGPYPLPDYSIISPTTLAVPATPKVVSIDPAPQLPIAPTSIRVSPQVQKQIVQYAKGRLMRFFLTSHAITGCDREKQAIIDLAIAESIPSMVGMNGQFFLLRSFRFKICIPQFGFQILPQRNNVISCLGRGLRLLAILSN